MRDGGVRFLFVSFNAKFSWKFVRRTLQESDEEDGLVWKLWCLWCKVQNKTINIVILIIFLAPAKYVVLDLKVTKFIVESGLDFLMWPLKLFLQIKIQKFSIKINFIDEKNRQKF